MGEEESTEKGQSVNGESQMVVGCEYHTSRDDAVQAIGLITQSSPEVSEHTTVEFANDASSSTTTIVPSYLVLSTFCYAILGYKQLIDALGITFVRTLLTRLRQTEWKHRVPALVYIIIYLLAAVLCLAVGIMLSYHVWSISCGETTVEGQDHEVYTKKAKSRGETFVNSYDLGRIRNLQLFFNVGEAGYPLYTLFIPLRIMPYTDGRFWARREGYVRHYGIRRGEELTDEEDEDA
ncbi:hypothetical protein C0995_009545 [Termitomyces sp. Mi166|nr:hypothetical protein C0995_009545 [Termitomyces sp. Mi166\